MTRLAATCAMDVRLQFRNGFYAATLLVLVFSVLLLRWLPTGAAAQLLPAVILGNVLINTFYFISGMLFLERVEGALLAQRVTPLRIYEYIGSKLLTLTTLSLIENLLLTLAVLGPDTSLLRIAIGVCLAAILFCLAGLIMVTRYASINEFLLPSIPIAGILCLPAISVFGVTSEGWYWLHPLQGPVTLMQNDSVDPLGNTVFTIIYSLFWIAPMYHWARAALDQASAA